MNSTDNFTFSVWSLISLVTYKWLRGFSLISWLIQIQNLMNTETKEISQSAKPWEKYIPTYVSMYYVDYRDNLNESSELLQKCIERNNLFAISENINDWWDYPEQEYLNEIERQMEADGIDFDYDWIDEIRDALWAKDDSDPVEDLLRNTGGINMYYSLGVEIDGWHEAFMCTPWRGDSEAMAEYKMRRALGIKKGEKAAEQIHNIVANASYGGEIRIYFQTPLKDMLSTKYDENAKDYRTIYFKGTFAVALYDPLNGSGDYEEIELDLKVPFKRDNLAVSDSDRYSLEQCFGMFHDWLEHTDVPQMSFDGRKQKKSDKPSAAAQKRAKEAEYERVFKAGGCTLGDTDYRRHRDTYYDNNVPCGTHCPHCGQFWID